MLPCKPHFFQPVLPGFENGLSIPVSFFKHLKAKECEEVVLRSLAGKLWHVKINGRRLEDGWKEFAKYHDLHVGDLLVFRHEGHMVFDVMVFDPSSCERKYTSFHLDVKEEMETSEAEKEQAKEPDLREFAKNKQVMTISEDNVDSSVHQNPYFVVNLTSYFANSDTKHIPRKFARENGLHNRNGKIVLVDQEGRSWLAELGSKKSDGQDYIKNGWRTFCIANDLKAGDSFIFELIEKGKKPVLKMRRLKRNLQTKKAGSSSNVILHFSFSKNAQLKIPMDFTIRNNLPRKRAKMIITNERGSSWPVSLAKDYRSGDIHIGHGWSAFAAANGIREGDDVMLELVKEGYQPLMRRHGVNKANKRNKKCNIENNQWGSLEDSEDVKYNIENNRWGNLEDSEDVFRPTWRTIN